jgi:hypothetical protein
MYFFSYKVKKSRSETNSTYLTELPTLFILGMVVYVKWNENKPSRHVNNFSLNSGPPLSSKIYLHYRYFERSLRRTVSPYVSFSSSHLVHLPWVPVFSLTLWWANTWNLVVVALAAATATATATATVTTAAAKMMMMINSIPYFFVLTQQLQEPITKLAQ